MKISNGLKQLPVNAVYDEIDSPVGTLTLIASPNGLHAVLWDVDDQGREYAHRLKKSPHDKILIQTKQQLEEYFQGKRKIFDIQLALNGTDFQMQAWKQLLKIPYGKTLSYAEQAEKFSHRNKARAVGMANGVNPISIIIPCHRVIGSNKKLVGFGGGIARKQWLLNHEATQSR